MKECPRRKTMPRLIHKNRHLPQALSTKMISTTATCIADQGMITQSWNTIYRRLEQIAMLILSQQSQASSRVPKGHPTVMRFCQTSRNMSVKTANAMKMRSMPKMIRDGQIITNLMGHQSSRTTDTNMESMIPPNNPTQGSDTSNRNPTLPTTKLRKTTIPTASLSSLLPLYPLANH
jgi:hypothetical protein